MFVLSKGGPVCLSRLSVAVLQESTLMCIPSALRVVFLQGFYVRLNQEWYVGKKGRLH